MPVRYSDSIWYKSIRVKPANVYVNDTNVPVVLLFDGTPRRADGADIVVTDADANLIPRTIQPVGDGTFIVSYRDPVQNVSAGGSQLYIWWFGESVNVANDANTWKNNHGSANYYACVFHLSDLAGNLVDDTGNYVGAPNLVVYQQPGKIGKSVLFNAALTSYINCGDVVELNAVQNYTISFWLSQVAVDVQSRWYRKNNFITSTSYLYSDSQIDGTLRIRQREVADDLSLSDLNYAPPAQSGVFSHYTRTFDGPELVDLDRMKLFINGGRRSIVLGVPAPATIVTPDLATFDFYIGFNAGSTNGYYNEFRIFTGTLNEEQNKFQYDNQDGFLTNATINLGALTHYTGAISMAQSILGNDAGMVGIGTHKDTGILSLVPTGAFGALAAIALDGGGDFRWWLGRFSYTALPANITLISAFLTVRLFAHINAGDATWNMRQLLTNRGVTLVSDGATETPATGGQPTWDNAFDFNGGADVPWGGGGVFTLANDAGAVLDTLTVNAADPVGTLYSFDVTAAVALQLLDDATNYGFLLEQTTGLRKSIDSLDAADTSHAPYLTLNYTVPVTGGTVKQSHTSISIGIGIF